MKKEDFEVLHGTSTTHAENTSARPLNACVDWVTVSFYSAKNDSKIADVFGAVLGIEKLEELEIREGARYDFAGYNVTYRLGYIDLMADHDKGRYLLNMSGQGCREFENKSKYDFITLFSMLSNFMPTYTRLDIAIDDYKCIYHVSTIRKAIYKGCCVSYLKRGRDTKEFSLSNPKERVMDQIYLGSKNSRYHINIYDKKLEQIEKGNALPVIDGQSIDRWTRTEVRFKNGYAEQFVNHILNVDKPIGYHIVGFLKEKITFLKPSILHLDSNKSRLAKDIKNHARWWQIFTREVENLPLTIKVPDNSLKDSFRWLLNQASTTFASLNIYDPDSFSDFIRMLVTSGQVRLQKRHINKIKNQLIVDGVEPESVNELLKINNTVTPEQIEEYRKRQNELMQSKSLKDIMNSYWDKLSEQLEHDQKNEFTEEETEYITHLQDIKEIKNDLNIISKFHDYKSGIKKESSRHEDSQAQ